LKKINLFVDFEITGSSSNPARFDGFVEKVLNLGQNEKFEAAFRQILDPAFSTQNQRNVQD